MTQHHFDTNVAKKYGILEAIILNHFEFWLEHNEKNGRNFYDGRYWTYNSMRAFSEIFPYVSERKIRNALKHLEDECIIVTGNYNKSTYDRTLWYAFSDLGKSILQKCQMEDAEMSNGNCKNVKPIPDNIPDNKTNNKTNNIYVGETPKITRTKFLPPSAEEVKAYCIERGNNVDAERFVDYYTANGWKVGKNSMKDWKAAVRTWERGDNNGTSSGNSGKNQKRPDTERNCKYGIVL